MKKSIFSIMLIGILIISNTVISFADSTREDVLNSFKNSLEKIEKISDIEYREAVRDLYLLDLTVAYYEIEATNEQYSLESTAEPKTKLNNVDSIKKMSTKEINKEITELVNNVIAKESFKDNIVWDENFVNTYVKKYASTQITKLKVAKGDNRSMLNLLATENIDIVASTTAKVKTTSYGRNTRGDSLFRLITTTVFGYDGTRVLSLYPVTTHKIDNSVWEFVGLDPLSGETIEYSASRGAYIGVVQKFGNFRMKVIHTEGSADLKQWCYEDGTYQQMYQE